MEAGYPDRGTTPNTSNASNALNNQYLAYLFTVNLHKITSN